MNKISFRKTVLLWVVAMLYIGNVCSPVQAATFAVERLDDANVGACTDSANDCTLRGAINASQLSPGADVINIFVSGTVLLNSDLPAITQSLIINGGTRTGFIVDGQNRAGARPFTINAADAVVTINDLTITRGNADRGGAIYNVGALTLNNCAVTENTATGDYAATYQDGGGIFNNGSLTLNNSSLGENKSNHGAGGISNRGNLVISSCFISGNRAVNGSGGGIHNLQVATITRSTFANNMARGGGGGIDSDSTTGNLIVIDSTFSDNISEIGGNGGIFNVGNAEIFSSTFYNNSSINGAAIVSNGTLVISSCTITVNAPSSSNGGNTWGVAVYGGTTNISNSIIAGNGTDVQGSFISGGYNLIGKTDGSTGFTKTTDKRGTVAAPLDPKLDVLRDDGGSTQTVALLPGSPAIDAGDDSILGPPQNRTFDQRGPGFARKHGAQVDIGAIEFNRDPVASSQNVIVSANASLTITLGAADSDNDVLTYSIVNPVANGVLQTVSSNQVTYTPRADFVGTDSFTFRTYDGTAVSNTATVTIEVRRVLSIADVGQTEGNSAGTSLSFAVTLSAPSTQTITVNYATANGLALAGSDYISTRGTLTFSPKQTTQTIVVPVIGDTAYELNETFYVKLSNPAGVAIAKAQGTGTIQNDDSIGKRGGKILFQTARDGNNEIYAMNADGSHQTNLTNSPNNDRTPGWRPDGKRIVWSRGAASGNAGAEIWVMDSDGTDRIPLTISGPDRLQPDYSADGKRIAFSAFGGFDYDVYLMDADGNNVRRVVNNQLGDYYPRWSPDNLQLLYSTFNYSPATYDYPADVYRINTDGSSNTRMTSSEQGAGSANADWSPDGTKIVFKSNRGGVDQIYIAKADGTNPVRLTSNPYANYDPTFSPDGTGIAFTSTRDGSEQIYVMDIDGAHQTRLTTTGGSAPSWAPGDAPNRAAVAASQSVSTSMNTPLAITLSAIDADGDALTYSIVTPPAHGTLSGTAPTLTYTPESGYFGIDAFTFVANDGAVNSTKATISIAVTDKVPPTVSVATPQNGSSLKTLTTISGTSSDNMGGSGIQRVNAYLRRMVSGEYQCWANRSGVWGWGASVTPIPTNLAEDGTWSVSNTSPTGTQLPAGSTNLPSGSYQFYAQAFDNAGTSAISSINKVTVDTSAPTSCVVTTPAHNSTIKGLTSIRGTAADGTGGSGIARVVAYLRRFKAGSTTTYEYWAKRDGTWGWGDSNAGFDTVFSAGSWSVFANSPAGTQLPSGANLATGSYQFYAYAYDKAATFKISSINKVTVDNVVPSSCVVSSPGKNATISTLTVIKGTATDASGGSGIARVDAFLRRGPSGSYEYWAKRNGVWGWGASATAIATTFSAGDWRVDNTTPSGTQLPTGSTQLPAGPYQVFAKAYDKADNALLSAINTFSVVSGGSEATVEEPVSSVVLSSVSAQVASSTVRLVFSGALDAGIGSDSARYSVSIDGAAVAVESVQVVSSTTVVLGLEKGRIQAGEVATVSYRLTDSKGSVLEGVAKVIVK